MSTRLFPLLYCLLTFPAGSLMAQFSLFTGPSFEHEVTEYWGYQFEVEHRRTFEADGQRQLLFMGAINRLITKRLDVTPGIRFSPKFGDDAAELRLFTDVNYAVPLGDGPFTLDGRLRSQYERGFSEATSGAEVAVRPRIGLLFDLLENTTLVAESEARYRFDDRNAWTRMRYTFGVEQELSTRISIDAFFRIERKVNRADPVTEHTIGLFLIYILPDERKRDWRYRSPFGRSVLW